MDHETKSKTKHEKQKKQFEQKQKAGRKGKVCIDNKFTVIENNFQHEKNTNRCDEYFLESYSNNGCDFLLDRDLIYNISACNYVSSHFDTIYVNKKTLDSEHKERAEYDRCYLYPFYKNNYTYDGRIRSHSFSKENTKSIFNQSCVPDFLNRIPNENGTIERTPKKTPSNINGRVNRVNNFTGGKLFIMLLNIRSIRNKICELEIFIENLKERPNIIIITESWLREDELKIFNLKNYSSIGNCRSINRGGGILILVENNLNHNIIINEQFNKSHLTMIKLYDINTKIAGIYRSPSTNSDQFVEILDDFLDKNDNLICFGDFNFDLLKSSNIQVQNHLNRLKNNNYLILNGVDANNYIVKKKMEQIIKACWIIFFLINFRILMRPKLKLKTSVFLIIEHFCSSVIY